MHFRHRLTLFLIVVLVAVQGATAFLGYLYLRGSAIEKAKHDLEAASVVFMRQLNLVSERVTDNVKVLSLDYALRQAIAQNDRGTELSALRNHGNRIGATRMMLIGLDGKVTTDTGARASQGPFPFPDLLGEAMEGDQGTALASVGGDVYWIVVVPVRAPLPIAFVAACIPVNNALLEKFRALATAPRSLALATRLASGRWRLVAQSVNHPIAVPLPARATSARNEASLVRIGDEDWVTATAPVRTALHSAPVAVVQGYPLKTTLSEFQSLVWPMLLIITAALLLALAGSILIARGLTRPLEALATRAGRIAAGDYAAPAPIPADREFTELSQALSNMTHSIAEREAALTAAITSVEAARNEAVRANEAKSQFLANMSHELRTPLNAIVGFSEMLSGQVLGPLGKPRYLEYARDISDSGGHLLTMVSKMLDLAEAEAGRLHIVQEPFDLLSVVQRGVTRFAPLAEKAGVSLSGPDGLIVWPRIDGDMRKLEHAIGGIIHNAIKFTPARGHVEVLGRQGDGRFSVVIRDSGVGMTADSIAVAVRPFHRMRSALDGEHQGAGLGLSFAKAIVEAHNGDLRINSTPGEGTEVEMAFPVSFAAASQAA
jgi:signal transduction histidine kinase